MPNPDGSIDTSKWGLSTLVDSKAALDMLGLGQRPQASISPFQGGYSTMLSGASTPFHNPTYFVDKIFQNTQQSNPPPPQSFGGTARNPFAVIANPFLQMAAWQKNIAPFIGGAATTQNPSAPTGNGSMSAGEKRWADIAAKMGLNWQVTKDVYMNPHRNGSPNPAEALGRQMDDKIWGDVFMQATGHAPNQQEWVDHYNAGGNWAYDPLTGHNDAIAEIERRRAELEAQTNPQDYPDWYQPPQ